MGVDWGTVSFALGMILTVLNIVDKLAARKKEKEEKEDKIKTEAKTKYESESDLKAIRQGNASIMVQLDKMDGKMDSMNERLIRVEESTKSAHHRIDGLEGRQ